MYPGEALGLPPVCGYEWRELVCDQYGNHMCTPRWKRFYDFCAEQLQHPKGDFGGEPLIWLDWQVNELVMPIFGQTKWNPERRKYGRQYSIVWIETARKSGKSHFLAAVLLYLLLAEKEYGGEVYGAARTKDQAGIVYKVASMMLKRNPSLYAIVHDIVYKKRITYPAIDAFYQAIAADDDNALGQDPSGIICDEIVAWRTRALWDSVRTGMGSGARAEPLMIAATTPGTDMGSFAKAMHDQMWKIMMQPEISPHTYVLMRNAPRTDEELEELRNRYPDKTDLPISTDVFDERNWSWPNPGIGITITWSGMREQAEEAKADPESENAFRVFKMAQWVSQTFRWMPMHIYDDNVDEEDRWERPEDCEYLHGRRAYSALDLSYRSDLTCFGLMIPRDEPDPRIDVIWWFWLPEEAIDGLDKQHGKKFSRWVSEGWITAHPGGVIDYELLYADMVRIGYDFDIMGMDADEWTFAPVIQRVGFEMGLGQHDVRAYKNTFDRMSPGMDGVKIHVRAGNFRHHGNPVARFCFDNVEVRRAAYNVDLIRPDKPERERTPTRIDAVPVAAMAENCRQRYVLDPRGSDDDGLNGTAV